VIAARCTFPVGAGVSRRSNLPLGDTLCAEVFDLLCRQRLPTVDADTIAELKHQIHKHMRLEILLEILAIEIQPHVVFRLFEFMLSAAPNFNHFALGVLSAGPILTTNQDLLIERALAMTGRRNHVVHLHGRCDKAETIVALIGQNLGGLQKNIRRVAIRELRDRNVVVLGYSGRDPDIMHVLAAARPSSVLWLIHGRSPMSPELAHLREVLGSRLSIIRTNTSAWLKAHLSLLQANAIRALGGAACPPRTNRAQSSLEHGFHARHAQRRTAAQVSVT